MTWNLGGKPLFAFKAQGGEVGSRPSAQKCPSPGGAQGRTPVPTPKQLRANRSRPRVPDQRRWPSRLSLHRGGGFVCRFSSSHQRAAVAAAQNCHSGGHCGQRPWMHPNRLEANRKKCRGREGPTTPARRPVHKAGHVAQLGFEVKESCPMEPRHFGRSSWKCSSRSLSSALFPAPQVIRLFALFLVLDRHQRRHTEKQPGPGPGWQRGRCQSLVCG